MNTPIHEQELPLQRACRWGRERAGRVVLTRPLGGAQVRDWHWAEP